MKALVMGGGMSGLATAINLLDLGVEVELIEADNMFGGRASSWLDEDGDMIDNALHVFFPYYVNLCNFFKKMGIYENIIWKDPEFYYMQEDGKEAVLRFPNLPAPLHAAAAYVSLIKAYTGLPKWKMIFTALGMGVGVSRYSKAQLDELDDITFGMWSMRMAPKGAFKPMEPGINGLTFTPSSMISAKVMINWFKKVSGSAETSRVGFANGGLGEIWVDNCLDYIKKKGGTYELGKSVTAINIEGDKVKSVTVNGSEERTADLYVSAISPYALRRVMPDESFKLDYFQDLWHFQYAPSLSLQTWFDRKLTDIDVTFFSNDCIFNTYADLSNVLPHVFKGGEHAGDGPLPRRPHRGAAGRGHLRYRHRPDQEALPDREGGRGAQVEGRARAAGRLSRLPGDGEAPPVPALALRQLLSDRRLHEDACVVRWYGGGDLDREPLRRAHRTGQAWQDHIAQRGFQP